MPTDLSPLEAEVANITTVVDSAVALINGFADRVEAEKEDPVRVQAIVDGMRAQAIRLGEAIVSNTPAEG
jgi:hypothetical protein